MFGVIVMQLSYFFLFAGIFERKISLYYFELVVSDDTASHMRQYTYLCNCAEKERVVVMMYYLTASSLDAHFYCVPPNK